MYKIIHSSIYGSYERVSVRPVWAVLPRPQVDLVIFFQTQRTWVAELHGAALERLQPWNTCKLVLDVKENGVLQRTRGRDVMTGSGF